MLATQQHTIVALAVFLLISFCFFAFRKDEPVVYEALPRVPYRSAKPTLRDTITSLFESIIQDPTEPYRDQRGQVFQLPVNKTAWTEPLGKKILIVDIDTREPTEKNNILNPELMDWEKLEMHGGGLVSNAILNHYLYAQIHGYDYKFYQAQNIKDHYPTWISPHVLYELVPDYQFVVAMDADVTLSHLEVPLEWMFNKWGITPNTSMALPWDTEEIRNNKSISVDSKGQLVLNTGLMIAQNLNYTMELLDAWRECTTEKRYPGCGQWKTEWSHEQRAFSEYIRYDFNETGENIVAIPCDDAMGWPNFKADVGTDISDCNGNFMRHHTLNKGKTKASASDSVMQVLSEVLQSALLSKQERIWYREPEVVDFDDDAPDGVQQKEEEHVQEQEGEEELSKEETKEKPEQAESQPKKQVESPGIGLEQSKEKQAEDPDTPILDWR